jgi:hypothetical protein
VSVDPPEPTPESLGTPTQMRGPFAVRHDVISFLRLWLPDHIEAFSTAHGLAAGRVPVPVDDADPKKDAYFDREPAAVDRWPMVYVDSGRRTTRAMDFTDDGSVQYFCTYPIRVFCWVKDEGWDRTIDMRDDLATCLQITFLAHTDLGSAGRLELVPSTVVTDYSRIEKVTGDRYVAGAYVGFTLNAVETLTDALAMPQHPERDTVSTVNVTGIVMPPSSEDTP